MVGCRTTLLAASWLIVSVIASVGHAQQIAGDSQLPGGQFRGKHIGFQPKYGRVPPPVPPHRRQNVRPIQGQPNPGNAGASAGSSAVMQTGYDDMLAQPGVISDGSMIIDNGGGGYYPEAMPAVGSVANIWGSAEYLLFWTKGMSVPALATTSPSGTIQDEAGVLGFRDTDTLFGDSDMTEESRSGGRYTLGFWLSPYQTRSLELTYLSLDTQTDRFAESNADFAILARPFFDTDANAEDSRLIVFPDLVEGSLNIDVSTMFETAEVLIRTPTSRCNGCLDYFIGYRYAQLEDSLVFRESTLSLSGPTQDATFLLTDQLETENVFNGGQLGVQFSSQSSPLWSMDLGGKIALGSTSSRIANSGSTVVSVPTGETSTQNSGLLVQESNRGTFESDEFSTITELSATLRRHLTCNLSLNVGYTFFLWTDVVRAGDNLDTNINITQLPPGTLTGEARPAANNETTDFWAQGLRFGIEGRF